MSITKIASRSIAARLLKVIHLVVDKAHFCGVPGRFIGENVAFRSSSGAPAALLSLDQEKAFDRVDWTFLRSTLYAMGFGQSFVGWVNLFYNNVSSCLNVIGYISNSFKLCCALRSWPGVCAGPVLVLFCPVFFESFLSFCSVSQVRHLLGAILRLSVCLLLFVGRGGVRFLGEGGVLVHPHLR